MADGWTPDTRDAAISASVDRYSPATVWALLRSVSPTDWRRLTEQDGGGYVWDDADALAEARDRLVAAVIAADDHHAGNWAVLLELGDALEARHVERVAQSREETVPWWLYEAGMEVCCGD